MNSWRITLEFRIKVLEGVASDSNKNYVAKEYEKTGIYVKDDNWYYIVNKEQNIVYGIPCNILSPIMQEIDKTGASMQDILKIIAVTQNPELMKDKL